MQPGTTAEWTRVVSTGIRIRPDGADDPIAVWWHDGSTTGGRIIDLANRLAFDDDAACHLIGFPRLINGHTATWVPARLFRHHTVVEGAEGREIVVHAIALVTVDAPLSGTVYDVRAEARWLVGQVAPTASTLMSELDAEDAAFDAADREMAAFLDSIGSRPKPAGVA